MKEAIGSTWTIQLMIIFILIFTCFLTLVMSYSRAYSIKNEALSITEKYEGISSESGAILNNFLKENAYKTVGNCPDDWWGASDLEGDFNLVQNNQKYYYCFHEISSKKEMISYEFRFFYKFNLPIIGDITTFKVDGTTNAFIGSDNRITNRKG